MTDKEKLEKVRAEIERRKKLHEKSLINPIHEGFGLQKVIESKISELTYLHSFIDSMQKEPKECMYSKDNYTDEDRKVLCEGCEEKCKFNKKEEPISEDLEEEIGKYCSNPENFITYLDVGFNQSPIKKDDISLIIKAIKFGANWQKEQMMKEAISGHVGQTINGMLRALSDETFGDMGFTAGDKVKLIIIKEE